MNLNNRIILLLLLASFASVSAVLFTPALPDIATYLNISPLKAQQTISIFLIGYATGNLPWGPIANRYGRRKTAQLGICISCFGMIVSLLILIYKTLWILNLGRLITALGASVGIKLAFTYIADLYSKDVAPKKISYLMLSFAIAPGIAIAFGGILTKNLGWYSCFIGNLVYGIIIFILSLKLPETLTQNHVININVRNILQGYLETLKSNTLIKASLLMGCATTFIYLFASLAPFIGINTIGLTPEQYGLCNFIPPLGMVIGFYLTNYLHDKMSSLNQIILGISLAAASSFVILYFFLEHKFTWLTLFLPIPPLYIGLSLVFANASALALSSSINKSNASAMTNFLNMGLCVVLLFVAPQIPISSHMLLSLFFIFLSFLMFTLFVSIKNHSCKINSP